MAFLRRILPFVGLGCAINIAIHCSPFSSGDSSGSSGTSGDGGPGNPRGDASTDAPAVCPPGTIFDSDPKNCGACGRDCGSGGQCVAGRCTAYVIAETPNGGSAWYITVDNNHVYWASVSEDIGGNVTLADGNIRRAPKLGGGPIEVVANVSNSFDLVVVKEDLIFTTTEDLRTVPKTGGQASQVLFDRPAFDIVERAGRIFFTGEGVFELGAPARQVAPKQAQAGTNEEGITVDGDNVYWAVHGTDAGSINRVPVGAVIDAGTVLVPSWKGARRMTSDSEAIYWTSDVDNAGVGRLPKIGGTATTVFKANVGYGTVIIDGPDAYVAAERDNAIFKFKKTGDAVGVVVARDLGLPCGLAQDETAIYFTERRGGKVWRMVK